MMKNICHAKNSGDQIIRQTISKHFIQDLNQPLHSTHDERVINGPTMDLKEIQNQTKIYVGQSSYIMLESVNDIVHVCQSRKMEHHFQLKNRT